jgi:hypothetical protein
MLQREDKLPDWNTPEGRAETIQHTQRQRTESWHSRHAAQDTEVSKGESARRDAPQETLRMVAESGRRGLLTQKCAEEHNTIMHSVTKKKRSGTNHPKGSKTPRSNGDAQRKQTQTSQTFKRSQRISPGSFQSRSKNFEGQRKNKTGLLEK